MLNKFKEKFKLNSSKNKKKEETKDNESTSFFVSKILIVDDVNINRYVIRKYIEKVRSDIQIYESSNGLIAIELNNKHHFDLIFMDIKMPGISGIETCKRIKETDSHVVIVGSTGQVEKNVIRECLDVGMTRVLGKPIDKREIEYVINGNNDSVFN